nr:ADP-ribosylglycohydrolase family protein [Halobacterium salinarum]
MVTAVNRGGDTDTIGAITGAVAGARFGATQLPDQWLSVIDESDELEVLARELVKVA